MWIIPIMHEFLENRSLHIISAITLPLLFTFASFLSTEKIKRKSCFFFYPPPLLFPRNPKWHFRSVTLLPSELVCVCMYTYIPHWSQKANFGSSCSWKTSAYYDNINQCLRTLELYEYSFFLNIQARLIFYILKKSETCSCRYGRACMVKGKKLDRRNERVTMFWKHHFKLSVLICLDN